jgi:hypothetical protein
MLSPFLICLTLVSGALAQDNQAPKRTEGVATPAAATVVVSGRVVYDDTGQPASRYRVQLVASEALLSSRPGLRIPTAITNERGEFSLRSLGAGEYYVFAESVDQPGSGRQLVSVLNRSGDTAADAAKLAQFKKNNLRITVDGQHNVDANLRVQNLHFGSVSGTVFDSTHQPAARATVHVMSQSGNSFGRSVPTDDDGRYKILGLPKGEYIVSVSPPSKEKRDPQRPVQFQGSPGATYFPSTLLLRDSPPVTVQPDVDTGNIDVTLMSRALHSLAGVVRMRGDNRPVTNATLRLSVVQINDPASDTSTVVAEHPMSNYMTSTDNTGHWSISNVPDGSYRLYVQPAPSEPTKARFVQVTQDVRVEGNDLEDLSIEVSEGARLSGVVVLEGGGAPPQFINVTASAYQPRANSIVRINEAGKFNLTGVPTGEVIVSAMAFPQERFYVKSVEANGLDLLRNNLPVAESAEIKDVRIVISTNVAVLTGRVFSWTGDKPVAGAHVMLRRKGNDKPRLLGGKLSAITDEQGVFTLSAAPGDYLVVAWRSADGPQVLDAAVNLAEQRPAVTLLAGARKELDLRLPW